MKKYGSMSRFKADVIALADKVSRKEIVETEYFPNLLSNVASGISLTGGETVQTVYENDEHSFVAYTDGRRTTINAGHPMLEDIEDQTEWLLSEMYLAVHETAHKLYSDFRLLHGEQDSIAHGKTFSEAEAAVAPKCAAFLKQAGPGQKAAFAKIFHGMQNSIEDGFVDYYVIVKRAPGYFAGREAIYKASFDENGYEESLKNGVSPFFVFTNQVLDYARMRKTSIPAGEDNEITRAFEKAKSVIEDGTRNTDPEKRMEAAWRCCEIGFEMLEELLKKQNEQQNQPQQQSQQSGGETGEGGEGSQGGNGKSSETQEQQNSSGGSDGESDANSESESSDGVNTGSEDSEGSDSKESKGNSSSGSSKKSSKKSSSSSSSSNGSGSSQSQDSSEGEQQSGSDSNSSNVSQDDLNNAMNDIMDSNKVDQGMKDEIGDKMQENGDPNKGVSNAAKKSLESLSEQQDSRQNDETMKSAAKDMLEKAKKEAATKAAEKAEEKEVLKGNAEQLTPQNAGKDNRCVSHRIERPEKLNSRYAAPLRKELEPYAKLIAKEFKRIFADMEEGGEIRGLYSGKLCPQSYSRMDMRYMKKEFLPEDIPDFEACIAIDRSGSMSGSKEEAAGKASFILYETMRQLGYGVSVFGFSTRHGVTHTIFADSKSSQDEGDRILNYYGSGGCNRDGYAIRFAVQKLEKSTADQKMFFMVSDGMPSDYGGNGWDDVRDAMRLAKAKGIIPVVIALGGCYECLEPLYCGQDVPKNNRPYIVRADNPKELPKAIMSVFRRIMMDIVA